MNRRGFSLIELMIVIVVMGVLAAIAIPRYNVTTHKSKEKEADMFLAQVFRLQEAYRNEHGAPATQASDLETVGFRAPGVFRYYTWNGTVAIPLCLDATGPWNSREVRANGEIANC